MQIAAIRRALLAWHDDNGMHAPWRESRDPYACLVAAVMAQQTQMSRVMVLYERFTAAFPTLEALAAASTGDVIRVWAGMGYNMRAVRLHRAAQEIAANGWARDAAALEQVYGIGPFTAAIIASFAFGEDAACVDTNVRRVLSRLAEDAEDAGDAGLRGAPLQRLADRMLPAGAAARWNQTLMDYGARVCRARPRCGECVVSRWCASRESFAANGRDADRRARYDAGSRVKREPAFEGSSRHLRGRIIDALRGLPRGASFPIATLVEAVPATAALSRSDLEAMIRALERDGLVTTLDGAISLPD